MNINIVDCTKATPSHQQIYFPSSPFLPQSITLPFHSIHSKLQQKPYNYSIMSQRLTAIANILGSQGRLQIVRKRCHLNPAELKHLLFSEDYYERYVEPTFKFFSENRHIFTQKNLEGQTLKQQRESAAKMLLAIHKYLKLDIKQEWAKLVYTMWSTTMLDGGILTKTYLHYFLYCKSLMLLGTNSKHEAFLADALSNKDIGCFGLTQFHHGSYSKEIQTLAHYDKESQQFVLSTQGTKGMKFWIGAASQMANMSVIWAQLIIDGKSQGPHAFVVPIRCKKTHKVLPKITIGDCGPKNGMNYIDNGYIILDDVRIPRENLLGKLGSVDEKGVYSSPIESVQARFGLHMSPLSGGRAIICFIGNCVGLKSGTVALRYACVRKQFDNAKKTDEELIIDYALTKNRIIPELAQTFVQIAPGADITHRYFKDPNVLADLVYTSELHAISACVKARVSWNGTSTAQNTRTILGGHGYSAFSNFKSYFHDQDINNTWQGDNNMLLQQTSKYLMKVIEKRRKTKIVDISFIQSFTPLDQAKAADNLRDPTVFDSLIKQLLVERYRNAKACFQELSLQFKNKAQVWLHFHPQAGNALSLAYADYFIYSVTKSRINEAKSEECRNFINKSLLLWGFNLLEKERLGGIDLRKALQKQIVSLCEELTDLMIVATDILVPSSHILGSVFGNEEGKMYEEYLNLIYSGKDTFTRVPYFGEITRRQQRS